MNIFALFCPEGQWQPDFCWEIPWTDKNYQYKIPIIPEGSLWGLIQKYDFLKSLWSPESQHQSYHRSVLKVLLWLCSTRDYILFQDAQNHLTQFKSHSRIRWTMQPWSLQQKMTSYVHSTHHNRQPVLA